MAIKISQMNPVVTPLMADQKEINQGGVTFRETNQQTFDLFTITNQLQALANLGQGGDPIYDPFGTTDLILTNPCPSFIVQGFDAPGHIVRLPAMNQPTSLSKRGFASILVYNPSNSLSYDVQYQDGTTLTGVGPQQIWILHILDNSTANGNILPQPLTLSLNNATGVLSLLSGPGIGITTVGQNITISGLGALTPFVVGTDSAQYVYQTIGAAMSAAALVASPTNIQQVIVTAGTYPDPWTWAPYVNLLCLSPAAGSIQALPSNLASLCGPVNITGQVTVNFSGNESASSLYGLFTNLLFTNLTAYFTMEWATIDATNNQAIQYNAPGNFCSFVNCNLISGNGFKLFDITNGRLLFINCDSSEFITVVPSTISASSVYIQGGNFMCQMEAGDNSGIVVRQAIIGTTTIAECVNLNGTSAFLNITDSGVSCTSGSGYWVTGMSPGGIITYNNVNTSLGNSHNIDPGLQINSIDSSFTNIRLNNEIFNSTGEIWCVPFSESSPSVMQATGGNGIVLDFTAPNFTISSLPAIQTTTAQMMPNTCYIGVNNTDTYQFPPTVPFGTMHEVICVAAGVSVLTSLGQNVTHLTDNATASIVANDANSRILFRCIVADTTFQVVDGEGSFTYT